jgi:hypothetical protein
MFDTVLTNLTTQGVASTGRTNPEYDNSCQYRGTDGRKCAAGWLIADEHYDSDMEGSNATTITVFEALVKSGVPKTQHAEQLISKMQDAHDRYMPGCDEEEHTLERFHEEMQHIAKTFRLTFTRPTT